MNFFPNNMMMPFDNGYMNTNNNMDFNNTLFNKLNELEKKFNNLEQRVIRLENEINNNGLNYSEPDKGFYMI